MNALINNRVGIASGKPATGRPSGATDSASRTLSLTTLWTILRVSFGVVPIVAGLDKFSDLLTNWDGYLNPIILTVIPISGHALMEIVGVVEISAGILVLARPRLGGFIVTAWLTCIALSLMASGRFLDVAVRDLVMAIGAFTLANLTPLVELGASITNN